MRLIKVHVPNSNLTSITNNLQTDVEYTLTLADAGRCIDIDSASSFSLWVPPDVDVSFEVGTIIEVCQNGVGTVTITPGDGVTLNSNGDLLSTSGQWATIGLRKLAENSWVVTGDRA